MRRFLCGAVKWTGWLLALGPALAWGQDNDPFGASSDNQAPDPTTVAQSVGLPANLVPAQFNVKQDSLGFSWQLDGQGMLSAVNNCPFQMGQLIQLNNNGIDFTSTTPAMMTPDQSEFVFVGNANGNGNIRVTRRAKLDLATGSVRFIDTFQNTGPAPQNVNINLVNNLGINISSVVLSPSGTVLGSNARFGRFRVQTTLGPKDCGLVVVPRSGGSSPAAIFYLGGLSSRVKPNIASNSGRDFIFSFVIPSLAPQKCFTIIHGVAQRNAPALDAKSLAKLYKIFQSRAWIADLPAELRKSIANLGKSYSSEEMPGGAILQPLLDAAAHWSVERGASDVYVQDEQSQLSGKLQGGEISVDSRFGKTTVPLADVALIVGGAGVEGQMRLYLRNGEILAGDLQSKEMEFKTANGLELKLLPAQIHCLFLHALRSDGTPPAGGAALIETHHGERLLVREKTAAKLQAATPWGPIQFTLDEVQGLYLRRDPQPVYRLLLKDGSRLPAMLQGDEMGFDTLRFGAIKLPAVAVAQIRGLAVLAAKPADDDDEHEASGEPKVPYCTLLGENVLVGALVDPQLKLQTATGLLSVEAARIRLVERHEGASPLVFAVDTGGKEPVHGLLADAALSIRRGGQVWRLPAHHVLGYRVPKAERAEEAAAPSKTAKAPASPAAKERRTRPKATRSAQPGPAIPAPPQLETNPSGIVPAVPLPLPSSATYPQSQPSGADSDPFGDR